MSDLKKIIARGLAASFLGIAVQSALPDIVNANTPSQLCDNSALTSYIPSQRSNAQSADQFIASILNLNGDQRDNAVVEEVLSGNIPDFLRNLQPVELRTNDDTSVVICVMPDYIGVGDDADYVRTPVDRDAAFTIAEAFGFALPTPRMVDAIYSQAAIRVSPRTQTPDSRMTTTSYFDIHNDTIEAQIAGRGRNHLVAGMKKDIVLSNRLLNEPNNIAIYGWHTSERNPIQPLNLWHGEYYADYSHGVRLVSRTVFVDGQPMDIYAALADPQLSTALSDEGPMPAIRGFVSANIQRGLTPAQPTLRP